MRVTAFGGADLEKMHQRIQSTLAHIAIPGHVPGGIEQRMSAPPLLEAFQHIVNKRADIGRYVDVRLQVPPSREQRVRIAPFQPALGQVVTERLYAGAIGIRILVPIDVKQRMRILPAAPSDLEIVKQWIDTRGGNLRILLQVPVRGKERMRVSSFLAAMPYEMRQRVEFDIREVWVVFEVPSGIEQRTYIRNGPGFFRGARPQLSIPHRAHEVGFHELVI